MDVELPLKDGDTPLIRLVLVLLQEKYMEQIICLAANTGIETEEGLKIKQLMVIYF